MARSRSAINPEPILCGWLRRPETFRHRSRPLNWTRQHSKQAMPRFLEQICAFFLQATNLTQPRIINAKPNGCFSPSKNSGWQPKASGLRVEIPVSNSSSQGYGRLRWRRCRSMIRCEDCQPAGLHFELEGSRSSKQSP